MFLGKEIIAFLLNAHVVSVGQNYCNEEHLDDDARTGEKLNEFIVIVGYACYVGNASVGRGRYLHAEVEEHDTHDKLGHIQSHINDRSKKVQVDVCHRGQRAHQHCTHRDSRVIDGPIVEGLHDDGQSHHMHGEAIVIFHEAIHVGKNKHHHEESKNAQSHEGKDLLVRCLVGYQCREKRPQSKGYRYQSVCNAKGEHRIMKLIGIGLILDI